MPAELEDDDLMEDSEEEDDVPSDLDALDSDDEEEAEEDAAKASEEDDEDAEADDDAFSLAEGSDADDLLPLDAEVPMGLIDYDGSDAGSESEAEDADEAWGGIASKQQDKGKRKRDEKESKKAQRKKLRSLPTFASYEDYAKMIEDGPEDNI